MIIIGCDYHPSFQQIAFVDTETGEFQEQRLTHRDRELSRLGSRGRFRVANDGVWGTSDWAARSPPPALSGTPDFVNDGNGERRMRAARMPTTASLSS